jgi:cytochrome c-type biogenesis protein
MISILFAFLAGVLTVAAPCTLPVLPILVGTSLSQQGKARPVFIALGFIASFAAVALVFNFVTQISGVGPDTLRSAAIVLLAIFGVLMLWPQLYEWISGFATNLLRSEKTAAMPSYQGAAGGFLLGTTLGLVWTPCAGPVLASILTLLATQTQVEWAALLLLFYAVGAAIPMLAIAYGGQYVTARVRGIAPYVHRLQQGFGVLVIGFAAAMYFQYDTLITVWLSGFYPSGQLGL